MHIEFHNGEHDANREDLDPWNMYSSGQHPGCTYYIAAGAYGNDTGTYELTVEEVM